LLISPCGPVSTTNTCFYFPCRFRLFFPPLGVLHPILFHPPQLFPLWLTSTVFSFRNSARVNFPRPFCPVSRFCLFFVFFFDRSLPVPFIVKRTTRLPLPHCGHKDRFFPTIFIFLYPLFASSPSSFLTNKPSPRNPLYLALLPPFLFPTQLFLVVPPSLCFPSHHLTIIPDCHHSLCCPPHLPSRFVFFRV